MKKSRTGKTSNSNFMGGYYREAAAGLLLLEFQRCGIDAVAQARGLRAVLEHVAQVGVALLAQHFGAAHAIALVLLGCDVFGRGGLPEARPARTGLELLVGAEQLDAAAAAAIDALLVVVPV